MYKLWKWLLLEVTQSWSTHMHISKLKKNYDSLEKNMTRQKIFSINIYQLILSAWHSMSRSVHGQCLVCAWSVNGLWMVCAYSVHGQCLVGAWLVHGQCIFGAWSVPGRCMVSTWSVHGQCMGIAWSVYDQCMVMVKNMEIYSRTSTLYSRCSINFTFEWLASNVTASGRVWKGLE